VFDTVITIFDKYNEEIFDIQRGLLVIIFTLLIWLWFYNRRKYHNLKHAIPANVVKNYLDSIIQNSNALKSSLFRGGGMNLEGVPSVMPLSQLGGGDSIGISGAPNTALMEELNQKKALIASLEAQLASSHGSQRELESKIPPLQNQLSLADSKIKELETLLARNRETGGGDEALKQELAMLIKERDEIRERLKEFEIISDDLANLKRLQQENEQLKRSLAAVQGQGNIEQQLPETSFEQMDPVNVSNILEDVQEIKGQSLEQNDQPESFNNISILPHESEKPLPTADAEDKSLAQDEKSKTEKTPEDLLSEFEKMLG
jgi:chromosome segregation ATPase